MKGPKTLAAYLAEFSGRRVPSNCSTPTRSVTSERAAIESYVASWDQTWSDLVSSKASGLPPMNSDTRCVIFVPARYEERRIPGFLDALLSETRGLSDRHPGSVELIILENWFRGEARDGTEEVVKDWVAAKEPPFLVHVLAREWAQDERCPMARGRKLLADVALLRAQARRSYAMPLYLLSEDADSERIQEGRTQAFIRYLDANPCIDAVCGVEERHRTALARNNLLLLDRRTWFFAETLLSAPALGPSSRPRADFHWNRVVTPGANVCFSAETYARIRGYSQNVRIFEDMDIGQRVSVLRGRWDRRRFVPNVGTVRRLPFREESSAARAILALARGAADPYSDCEDQCTFFDADVEQAVRHSQTDDLLDLIRPYEIITETNRARFEEVLSMHLREVTRILRDRALVRRIFKRVLWLLGFHTKDYRFSDDGVDLVCIERFRTLAQGFRKRVLGPDGYKRYGGLGCPSHRMHCSCHTKRTLKLKLPLVQPPIS